MRSKDVDEYINRYRGITKDRLLLLRELAHKNIPRAHEKISYGVPTICDKNGKYIAYFAGYKDFVSIYPIHQAKKVVGIDKYISGKSTARFKNNDELPKDTVEKLFKNLLLAYEERRP